MHLSKSTLDERLKRAVRGPPGLPGVCAVVTDREGTLYSGGAGLAELEPDNAEGSPMAPDTVCAVFSVTKAMTGVACLQLMETGQLDLDVPAQTYVPDVGMLQVLEGFDDDGAPRLRAPRRAITTRMLLLHTAGLAYDFFDPAYLRLRREHGQPDVIEASRQCLKTPLLFDPGERWQYGTSVDWAGLVVEAIAGARLGDVMDRRIFEPLGMKSTGFTLSEEMKTRRGGMHRRRPDGTIERMAGFELPTDPEVHMGGHGLYSTAEDCAAFLRMWLAGGSGPHGRVLAPDTVAMASRDHLQGLKVTPLVGQRPRAACNLEFFAGMPKSWAITFMVNDEQAPTGRSAGSLAWAGLANLYYWIDMKAGIAGFWATQLFPFADETALSAYLDFETAVYGG